MVLARIPPEMEIGMVIAGDHDCRSQVSDYWRCKSRFGSNLLNKY